MPSKQLDFITMDVFTDRQFGGNPLAIFPDAGDLTSSIMQKIAAEMNLSETVFIVSPRGSAIPRIRIFTPEVELPFAGHPTVGAALFLADRRAGDASDGIRLDTKAGRLEAQIYSLHGRPHARIMAPEAPYRGPAPPSDACSAFLSLPNDALAFDPVAYSAGVPYTIVPLRSRELLAQISPDLSAWHARLKHQWASAVYAVWMSDWLSGREVHARMFGPGVGILEDPATGSAALALTGWLCDLQATADDESGWIVHQGEDMNRPSQMIVGSVNASNVPVSAHVSGTAVTVMSGKMSIR